MATTVLAVPVGSTEQHGPHLPLATDTEIAMALAARLAAVRADVLVSPAVAYGSSGEHQAFAGTLSIGPEALTHLLVELGRSADGFAGVVLVSSHGGNATAVSDAVSTLVGEGRRVRAWSPSLPARWGSHAGSGETSMLLAMRPEMVRVDQAEPGNEEPVEELMATMRAGGVGAVSANGVLGDPRPATAVAGERLLAALTDDLAATYDRWFGAPS